MQRYLKVYYITQNKGMPTVKNCKSLVLSLWYNSFSNKFNDHTMTTLLSPLFQYTCSIRIQVFWYVTPCRWVSRSRCYEGRSSRFKSPCKWRRVRKGLFLESLNLMFVLNVGNQYLRANASLPTRAESQATPLTQNQISHF